MGLDVSRSPLYDMFAGSRPGERVAAIVVRLFARPDLASPLRAHLPPQTVINVLNAYRPKPASRPSPRVR